jgi:hypothetical protein
MNMTWPSGTTGEPPTWTFDTWEDLETFADEWLPYSHIVTCRPPRPDLNGAFFPDEPDPHDRTAYAYYRISNPSPDYPVCR